MSATTMRTRMSTERTQEIEEAASHWLIRRDSGDWTPEDEERLGEWLSASSLHRVTFWRLQQAWEDAARLKALGAGVPGVRPPPRGEWNLTPFFDSLDQSNLSRSEEAPEIEPETYETTPVVAIGRELTTAGLIFIDDLRPKAPRAVRITLFATAASLVLAVGVGLFMWIRPPGDRYETPIGGIASVPLQDGSNITLNTATALHVALTGQERDIDLAHGEAFFEVAKDAKRPFVVNVGKKRVVAVGTQFSVLRAGDDIRVIVSEGTVRIEDRPGATSPPALPLVGGTGVDGVLLSAGSVAHAGNAGVLVQKESLSQAQDQLSWRTGILMFRDQTLGEAVAEFNRYNERQIVIRDPSLAQLRIEGNFRATNVDAFVRLLESGFPVRVLEGDSQIVLSAN
jgi:transmembrane sensor